MYPWLSIGTLACKSVFLVCQLYDKLFMIALFIVPYLLCISNIYPRLSTGTSGCKSVFLVCLLYYNNKIFMIAKFVVPYLLCFPTFTPGCPQAHRLVSLSFLFVLQAYSLRCYHSNTMNKSIHCITS